MTDAVKYLRAAAEAYHAQRLDEASNWCEQALRAEPRHAAGRNLAGVIAWLQGRNGQALEHLHTALEVKPDEAEYRQNLALVLLALNRPAEAVTELDRVLKAGPDNHQALELRAQAKAEQSDWPGALLDYRALLARDAGHGPAQSGLVAALSHSRLDPADAVLAGEFERSLDFQQVESNLLARPLARFLGNRHGITGDHWDSSLQVIAADGLLQKALNTLYFTDPVMERFLTRLRRRLLEACREQGRVPNEWQGLMFSLARHNLRNEYAHFEAPAETEAVAEVRARLGAMMEQNTPAPERVSGVLLLFSLYRPLNGHPAAARIRAIPVDAWPERAQGLIHAALIEPQREAKLSTALPALGELQDTTSVQVAAMYEDNPYPRWERLGPARPGRVDERIREQIPGFLPPPWSAGDSVQVLIAGAGTGRHALRAAVEYTNAQVLAIDISRKSLAYAQRKANELQVGNLELMQADLFELPKLKRSFHLIETIGTLETLDHPERGWEVLSGLLAPGGLMYVGSYSELARRPVVAARERIAEAGLTGTPEDMRGFRKRVLDGELGEAGERLMQTGDFYSLSGCRDLLFHVREQRFRLRELSALWERFGLSFLTFHPIAPPLRNTYRERYPDDPDALSIHNWIEFEEQEPDVFGKRMGLSMFYYWLQKRET